MLTLFNGGAEQFCDGISRRSFLRAGGLALGGLALSDFLRLKAAGAVTPNRHGKSVIMICLGGGPSHLDTYDMKPDAPSEFRGEFHPIKSNVPGMYISDMLPLHYPPRAMPWSYAPPGSSDGCPLPVPHPLPDEVEDDGEREEDDQRRQGRRVGEDRGRGEVDGKQRHPAQIYQPQR